jgi:uncharacterized protein (TIGR02597 family)
MNALTRCFLFASLLKTVTVAQVTVYSEVGGFDTIQITGTGGGGSKLTVAATEFLQAAKYSGLASVTGPATLFDATATWADNAFNGSNGSHYLEILSVNGSTQGPGVGATRTIVSSEAATKSLLLELPLPTGLVAPIEYRILSHWTLAAIFGANNTAGLQGGNALSADLVQLWNGSGYDSFYYQTGGIGGTGWRKVGDQTSNAGGTIIRPDQSVLIKRVGATALPWVVTGWIKLGQTSIDIAPGFNFVPNPYSEAMTLGNCGLFTGSATSGIAGGSATSADQVKLWNGSGYDTFYYQTSGIGGTGWRKVGAQSTDASAVSIAPGTSIIVRRNGPSGFTWAIPQPPTGL